MSYVNLQITTKSISFTFSLAAKFKRGSAKRGMHKIIDFFFIRSPFYIILLLEETFLSVISKKEGNKSTLHGGSI